MGLGTIGRRWGGGIVDPQEHTQEHAQRGPDLVHFQGELSWVGQCQDPNPTYPRGGGVMWAHP